MRRRRSPAEKKARAYTKDHITGAEYPQAFRRLWPRKRARASRHERRRVRQLLRDVMAPQRRAEQADFPLRPIRRAQVRKWPGSAVPLGEWVSDRLQLRARRTAWNFFKRPYHAPAHRERFVAFLEALTAGVTPRTAATAHMVARYMQAVAHDEGSLELDRAAAWLRAFFADEPAWPARIARWVAAHGDVSADPPA